MALRVLLNKKQRFSPLLIIIILLLYEHSLKHICRLFIILRQHMAVDMSDHHHICQPFKHRYVDFYIFATSIHRTRSHYVFASCSSI